jgi:signal recognition particle GTPase
MMIITIDATARARIGRDANVPVMEVNQMLKQYDQFLLMWQFLKKRQTSNQTLPTSTEDAMHMLQQDPTYVRSLRELHKGRRVFR